MFGLNSNTGTHDALVQRTSCCLIRILSVDSSGPFFEVLIFVFLLLKELRGVMRSLIVKAGGDLKDVRCAFVRCDDSCQAYQLLVVSEVSDPVEATGGCWGNVPLDCGVTLPV